MNQSDNHQDHGFSSFSIGLTLGVVAALIIGTEEGRKIAKELYNSLPEKYKKIPETLLSTNKLPDQPRVTPIIPPLETPHHATYEFESPPPTPPAVPLTRPQSTL